MSDTPLSDERSYSADCLGKTLVVNAEWARELERKNAALRDAYNKLETDLMNEVDELRFESDGLRVELEQQAICNGAGAERELALRSTIAELQRENAALRQERDSYRFRSEQIWGLRKEIQAALGVPADCEGEEALKRGLESIAALRADKERLDWLTNTGCWLTFPGLSRHQNWKHGTARDVIDLARKEAQP